jgi:hypothetical protein
MRINLSLKRILIAFSPTAVLVARRKVICPVCTVDDARPVMIEEGPEREAHARTKVHKRLASKARAKSILLSAEPAM